MESGSSDSEEDYVDGMAPEVLMSAANIHTEPQQSTQLSSAGIPPQIMYPSKMGMTST